MPHPADSRVAQIRLRQTLAAILGGILAISVIAVGTMLVMRGKPIPQLFPAQLAAAEQLWQRAGPTNYVIETRVEGMQPAVYRVRVQSGRAMEATYNGNRLRDPRTLGTWSVPGMFGTIGRDVAANAKAKESKQPEPLYLGAEFDADVGIPKRYIRSDLRHGGTTSWEVVTFTLNVESEALE